MIKRGQHSSLDSLYNYDNYDKRLMRVCSLFGGLRGFRVKGGDLLKDDGSLEGEGKPDWRRTRFDSEVPEEVRRGDLGTESEKDPNKRRKTVSHKRPTNDVSSCSLHIQNTGTYRLFRK